MLSHIECTLTHSCTRVYIEREESTCTCVYIERERKREKARESERAVLHTYIHAYIHIHTYIYIHIHTYTYLRDTTADNDWAVPRRDGGGDGDRRGRGGGRDGSKIGPRLRGVYWYCVGCPNIQQEVHRRAVCACMSGCVCTHVQTCVCE